MRNRNQNQLARNAAFFIIFLALAVLLATSASGTESTSVAGTQSVRKLTKEDYMRAERFLPQNLAKRIKNMKVVPTWIAGSDRFWYRREKGEGTEFVKVDAASGKKTPAFDHKKVATGLSKLLGEDIKAANLPFSSFTFAPDEKSISFSHGKKLITCRLADGHCTSSDPPKTDPTALVSPDGKKALFRRSDNLWLRHLESGDEKQLTWDGAPFFSFGAMPDANLMNIPSKRGGLQLPPVGVLWGPDSRTVIAQRLDEREIREYFYWEPAPVDGSFRPVVHPIRMRLLGEPEQRRSDFFVFDLRTGKRTLLRLPLDSEAGSGSLGLDASTVFWTEDAGTAFMTAANFGSTRIALLVIDAKSGAVRTILEESADTFVDVGQWIYSRSNVHVVNDGDEVIWYSERDGWGHLYLYDADTGALKNRITSGKWVVWNVLHIDDKARYLYFTAAGREQGRHPYYRHLYRVDFDGRNLALLTPEDADHELNAPPQSFFAQIFGVPTESPISPSGLYVVDTYSTVSDPPISVLRSGKDGTVITVLERADVSGLKEIGWKPPEIVAGKAADGKTDVYGVLYTPTDLDPLKSYPVVEHIYAGPQTKAVPNFFAEGIFGGFAQGNQSLAELGFAVIVLDGPGTPGRSKAFHDMPFGKLDRWGIEHHVAAIKSIGQTRPYLDLDRVGVTGHSFGGYGSAMAMLLHADFYKVAVSSAGSYDGPAMYSPVLEKYFGVPDYERGSIQAGPSDKPGYIWETSASANADKLQGRLLLAVGDLDENAPPAAAFQFVKALIEAGKSFDFLYLPGRSHYFSRELYFVKQRWDYFVEYLLDAEPLRHYQLKVPDVRSPSILR